MITVRMGHIQTAVRLSKEFKDYQDEIYPSYDDFANGRMRRDALDEGRKTRRSLSSDSSS
jgi:hypothetical protein